MKLSMPTRHDVPRATPDRYISASPRGSISNGNPALFECECDAGSPYDASMLVCGGESMSNLLWLKTGSPSNPYALLPPMQHILYTSIFRAHEMCPVP